LPRKQVGKVTRWHVKRRKQDWHLGAPDMATRGLDGLVLNCAAHREDCGEAEARPDALARDVGAIAQSQRAGLLHGPRRGRSPFHMKWKPISGVVPRGSLLLNAVTDLERMIEQTLDAEKK
jgi:hypothetical protein